MKREIKFRAWDKIEHQMLFSGIDYQLRLISHICQDEFADESVIGFSRLDWDRFDLMQYTGLHDKNGKEIYEGDIWLMNGIKSQPMIVCFDNGKFISKSTWGEYLKRDDGYTYWDFIDGEVIGNIYENPELLN